MFVFIPDDVVDSLKWRIESFKYFSDNTSNNDIYGIRSLEERVNLVNQGLIMFSEKPIIGHGIGSFRYYGESLKVSHNDYLQVLAEQGLIGFILYILIFFTTIKQLYYNIKNKNDHFAPSLSLLGLAVYMIFINANDNMILWTAMAMVSASKYFTKNKSINV